jgi:hypothetical protein
VVAVPLWEKVVRTVAHFQRWPTVDFSKFGRPLPHDYKEHVILENCKGIVDGRLKGFVLMHEDGNTEYFDLARGKEFVDSHRTTWGFEKALLLFLRDVFLFDDKYAESPEALAFPT